MLALVVQIRQFPKLIKHGNKYSLIIRKAIVLFDFNLYKKIKTMKLLKKNLSQLRIYFVYLYILFIWFVKISFKQGCNKIMK